MSQTTCTLRETVEFYLRTNPNYAPSFRVADVAALLAERDALYAALETALEAANTTAIDTPLPEDFPVRRRLNPIPNQAGLSEFRAPEGPGTWFLIDEKTLDNFRLSGAP